MNSSEFRRQYHSHT